MNDGVETFRIEIPESEIDDLRARLGQARWPRGLPEVGWSRGIPPDHLRELAAYWAGDFDFCIDSEFDFVSEHVRTLVTSAP